VGCFVKIYRYNILLFLSLLFGVVFPSAGAQMTDDELMTFVQEGTFKYFWDFGHPTSGLSREGFKHNSNTCTSGGTGMGIMTIVVGAERGVVTRSQTADRILKMFRFLEDDVVRYHGVWPHWFNGHTGATIRFGANDDGGDIVETAFLVQGILTARQYFDGSDAVETEIRTRATRMWESVEWDWHLRRSDPGYEDSETMYWHWSPNYGWVKNFALRGYYEAMIVYILGVASPTHPIPASCYFNGWASRDGFTNSGTFYGYRQWVGPNKGGPLFWSHYSFLGFDPRYASDGFCNYYRNNRNTSLINRAHCIDNPNGFVGYGENCWGLTASTGVKCDGNQGYSGWSPTNDCGNITPTAAISAIAYTPDESLGAMRHFYYDHGNEIWGTYGFIDAFNLTQNWYSGTWLAIDQGTIVPMIENHRTGLCWDLFMSNPEIQPALDEIGFVNDPYNNMLTNPGFEDGASGSFSTVDIPGWTQWGAGGWLHSNGSEAIGRKALKIWSPNTGGHQDVSVSGRRNYVVSGYLASFSREPLTNRRITLSVEWYDGGASLITKDLVGSYSGGTDPYDEWKYVEATLAAPENAVTCRVTMEMENMSGSSSGVGHFDALCIVPGECSVVYDGDFNQDCFVDLLDLNLLAEGWLNPHDLIDLSKVSADWKQ